VVIDVQEKLFPHIENGCAVLAKMEQAVGGFQILNLPIFFTEQYPKGLGPLVAPLKRLCKVDPFSKTSFSCLGEQNIREYVEQLGVKHWVLAGLEAHVCVFQTAKDLLQMGHEVVVLNDAIGARSIFDYSTAIGEMRDVGVRISSVETILFEILADSKAPEFKAMSELVKCAGGDSSQCCCA